MEVDSLLLLAVVLNFTVLTSTCFPGSTSLLGSSCSTCATNATCLLNHSCSTDHSKDSQLPECSRMSRRTGVAKPTFTSTTTIYDCPLNKHCTSRTELNDSYQFIKVSSVRGRYIPENASHFALDVIWDWFQHDLDSIHLIKGYELRVKKDRALIKCLCILDTNIRNISLGVEDAFKYDSAPNQKLELSLATFPFDGDWEPYVFTETYSISWPKLCNGSNVCLPQLPLAPSLETNYIKKELKISWTATSPEGVYYVELRNTPHNETITIFVNGSSCVMVSGLPFLDSWSVRVQSYATCSGLSTYFSGISHTIGCGPWSLYYYVTESTVPLTLSTTSLPNRQPSQNFSLVVSIVIGLFFVVIVSAAATIIFFYLWRINSTQHTTSDDERSIMPMYSPFPKAPAKVEAQKPAKVEALVLYSLGTPTHERIEIEKYVVGFLKQQHFKVISCNDHTEKTIVQWVEENARRAHAVFIICNKQFGLDWKMNTRPQLVNSLEMIVASAVGQNHIKKYATILLRPEDEKYIPDNLYFKGMKSFVIGSKASCDEKANLASFVKFNSAIPCN